MSWKSLKARGGIPSIGLVLVGMVGAAAVTPAVARGVSAAASGVIIVDPDTPSRQVEVTKAGALTVSDGKGPMNVAGKVQISNRATAPIPVQGTVNLGGPVSLAGPVGVEGSVAVAGPVDARPAVPAAPFQNNFGSVTSSGPRAKVFEGTRQGELALTSFTFGVEGPTAGSAVVELQVLFASSPSQDCSTVSGIRDRFAVVVPVGQSFNVTWPTPWVLPDIPPTNGKFCLVSHWDSGPTDALAYVSASGFLP